MKRIGNQAFMNCSLITTGYYQGTASEWNEIEIGYDSSLTSATRYYYSAETPTTTGFFWRYVNDVPTPW